MTVHQDMDSAQHNADATLLCHVHPIVTPTQMHTE
jgi:hypothetical protein